MDANAHFHARIIQNPKRFARLLGSERRAQILRRPQHNLGVIPEESDCRVTLRAQEATHSPGRVVVIDAERHLAPVLPLPRLGLVADGAGVLLDLGHLAVVLLGDSVGGLESVQLAGSARHAGNLPRPWSSVAPEPP